MEKYRVTSKHPFLKEGTEISYDEEGNYHYINYFGTQQHEVKALGLALVKEWIEEIQEPEFTKQDMIDFAMYMQGDEMRPVTEREIEEWKETT
jgi:hypothetical protein